MPIDMAFAAAGYGFIYGLWPIAWIIVAAVFLYKLTVASGQFDIIRSSVISITDDQRLQVLLIGFSFGALLEGRLALVLRWRYRCAAGGLASNRYTRRAVSDCQHCAGGVWCVVPILVAGQVTGIDPFDIGAMAGRRYRSCRFLCRSGWQQ